MTYKVPMYYVVKVQEGRSSVNKIVKYLEYISGPFGDYDLAVESKLGYDCTNGSSDTIHTNVVTHYVDVEVEL